MGLKIIVFPKPFFEINKYVLCKSKKKVGRATCREKRLWYGDRQVGKEAS